VKTSKQPQSIRSMVTQRLVSSIESDPSQYNYSFNRFNTIQVANVSFPRNLKVSSNTQKESIAEIRNQIRENIYKHTSFRPQLENLKTKKMLKDVYTPNKEF